MIGIVIAKEPVSGRVKTRLCPPCDEAEAATIAEAALADTLATVAKAPFDERVLVLDGHVGPWLPAGFRVIPQRGDGLGERLAAAFADVGGPAILVGMDTPQLTSEDLASAASALDGEVDAVLGPAADGGWWAIGLREPDPEVFVGVPMSTAATGSAQLDRLRGLGLRTELLPTVRDVDSFEDAVAVAGLVPAGCFAHEVERVSRRLALGVHG